VDVDGHVDVCVYGVVYVDVDMSVDDGGCVFMSIWMRMWMLMWILMYMLMRM